jgi:hypothetical protein
MGSSKPLSNAPARHSAWWIKKRFHFTINPLLFCHKIFHEICPHTLREEEWK